MQSVLQRYIGLGTGGFEARGWVVVVVAEHTDVVSTPRTQNAPRSLFSFFTSNSISSRPRRICSSCLVNFCFFSILFAIFFGSLQYPLFLPSLYDMISVLGTKEYAWLRCSYLQPYQKTRCVMGRPFSWAWVGILFIQPVPKCKTH